MTDCDGISVHTHQVWHFGGDEAKNILAGGGYKDSSYPEEAKQAPFTFSPACKAYVAQNGIDEEALMSHFAQKACEG